MEIRILEMGAAKMVQFSLDTNAQQQTSLAYFTNISICGNGIRELSINEQCDDGNIANGDGCGDQCIVGDFWSCSGDMDNSISNCDYEGPI